MSDQEVSKRSADEDSMGEQEPSNKRAKGEGEDVDEADKINMRFLIQSKHAGAIIGRSGGNIKRLRTEYKADVTVPDCYGPERILSLRSSLGNILKCMKEILPLFRDPNDKDKSDKVEVRMLVHQSSAGAIIGRAGFKIKDLREKSSCEIKVYTQLCPNSFERVVQFRGSVDNITAGIKLVQRVVSEAPIKGPVQEYDPFCHSEERNYGGHPGMGGGRGYGPPPFGGGGGGRYMDSMPMRRSPMSYGGGRMQMRNGGGRRDGGGGGGGGRGDRRSGGYSGRRQESMDRYLDDLPYSMNRDDGDGEITETQVTIPTDYAGAIIGYKGNRIREIRQISNAQIKIDEPLPGSDERIITIKGTHEAITNAQYLLQTSVRQNAK